MIRKGPYTRQDIIDALETAKAEGCVHQKTNLYNYKSTTKDTDELYTEVVAEWLCNNRSVWDHVTKKVRAGSYRVETHNGTTKRSTSNRLEERYAMALYNKQEVPLLGEVLDYQTPLENGRCASIDLLGYDGSILRLIELKAPSSKESTLRCIIEIHTYKYHLDIPKLLENFRLPPNTCVKACILVAMNGAQHQELLDDMPHLKKLMLSLPVVVCLYDPDDIGSIMGFDLGT